MKIYNYYGRKNLCGDKVRQARQQRRLSQSDLSAKLQVEGINLERDSLSRIELGTRFVADFELFVIAKVLHVDILWLLTDNKDLQ